MKNKLFEEKNWQEALTFYKEAIELNNEDDYPKRQKNKCLKEIGKSNLSLFIFL